MQIACRMGLRHAWVVVAATIQPERAVVLYISVCVCVRGYGMVRHAISSEVAGGPVGVQWACF